MIYVYELLLNEKVVYVGVTKDLLRRYKEHTKLQKGRFYKQNVHLNIIGEFETRKEALKIEGQKKNEYGFEWTERLNAINNGKTTGKINGKTMHYIYECPRCYRKAKGPFFLGKHIKKGTKSCPLK